MLRNQWHYSYRRLLHFCRRGKIWQETFVLFTEYLLERVNWEAIEEALLHAISKANRKYSTSLNHLFLLLYFMNVQSNTMKHILR